MATPGAAAAAAAQLRQAAALWLAGLRESCGVHRAILLCARSETLRKRMLQCFLLNGLIFLGSLSMLNTVVIPSLYWILPENCISQYLCDHEEIMNMYSFLRSTLVGIFYALWFFPLYIFSFVLSALWYNDIAKNAFDVLKSQKPGAVELSDSKNVPESSNKPDGLDGVVHGIGEQVYSVLLLTIFFFEVSIAWYIPYLGKAISFLLLSWMYAYYCFESKWNFLSVSLNRKLDYFESNWAFFAGFGTPCVFPNFFFSPLVSYGVMAILYPVFVLAATGSEERVVIDSIHGADREDLFKVPVFFISKRITTQGLLLFPNLQKEQ